MEGQEKAWPGEAKIAGTATPAGAVTAHGDGDGEDGPQGESFVADITEVVVTGLNPEATLLVVEWWTPAGGLQHVERE